MPRPASSAGGNAETRSSPYNINSHQRRRSGSNIPSETRSSTIGNYVYPSSSSSTYLQPPSATGSAVSLESLNQPTRVTTSTYSNTLPIPTHTSRAPGHFRRATTDGIPHIAISEPINYHSNSYHPYTTASQSSSPSSIDYVHQQFAQAQSQTTTLGISQPSLQYAPSLPSPHSGMSDYGASSSRLSVPGVYPSQSSSSSSYYQAPPGSRSTPSINIVTADAPNPSHSPQSALPSLPHLHSRI